MTFRNINTLAGLAIAVTLILLAGCGPGWEGYEDNYSEVVEISSEPWEGPETVFVVLDEMSVEVPLAGLRTYDYNGAPSVLLSELIIAGGIAAAPEDYRYDFTATDGYNLLKKRGDDLSLLPGWEEMKKGYLYLDSRYDDLTCGWKDHPWGSAVSAYHIKWMNGGTITLLSMDQA